MTQEDIIRKQLDEAMPNIIAAMKLKLNMLQRELMVASLQGREDAGNALHLNYLETEVAKTEQLLNKIDK